jgi:hypothetical protein
MLSILASQWFLAIRDRTFDHALTECGLMFVVILGILRSRFTNYFFLLRLSTTELKKGHDYNLLAVDSEPHFPTIAIVGEPHKSDGNLDLGRKHAV